MSYIIQFFLSIVAIGLGSDDKPVESAIWAVGAFVIWGVRSAIKENRR